MFRNLLATTALAMLTATGVYAQQATTPKPAQAPVTEAPGSRVTRADGSLVTNIIGETVYNGTGDDAENIGKVSDVVFDTNGQAKSAVIGVGGFLGLGTKEVAFDYGKLQWAEKNGDRWLVAQTTKDELKGQPDFDRVALEPAAENKTPPSTSTDTTQTVPAAMPVLASAIIGKTVYNGTGNDAQNIGDVNDIVLAKDGKAKSLILGVGGFLGIGEKDVAYDFEKVQWAEKNGSRWVVAQTTKEELESQPAFDRKAYDPAPATTASNEVAPAPTATVPAAPSSDSAQKAPAPADQTTTGSIDKSTLTETPIGQIRAEDFVGTTVYGANDVNVGEIGDVVLNGDKTVDAVIIDVGGFLGVGEKEVAVGMDNLKFMTDKNGRRYLYTTFTKEQLEAQAAYDKGTYVQKRSEQRMILR
ncbi:PRC-barrel domain-containing protein [Mesorhizobium sp. M1338]|uniref:PRC-barrel domain-containing protein n=1 Tax=unclassified Mesorhizobium TaxID=325217 RepID=UPI00333512CD